MQFIAKCKKNGGEKPEARGKRQERKSKEARGKRQEARRMEQKGSGAWGWGLGARMNHDLFGSPYLAFQVIRVGVVWPA
jgi:hypothetical protein